MITVTVILRFFTVALLVVRFARVDIFHNSTFSNFFPLSLTQKYSSSHVFDLNTLYVLSLSHFPVFLPAAFPLDSLLFRVPLLSLAVSSHFVSLTVSLLLLFQCVFYFFPCFPPVASSHSPSRIPFFYIFFNVNFPSGGWRL